MSDGIPYHRLFRTSPNFAWWRPLLAVVLFGVFAVVALIAVSVVWIVIAVMTGQLDLLGDTGSLQSDLIAQATDVSNPLSLFLLLASLVVLLPLVPAAMLCAGLRPVSLRHSVAFRLRWGWLARCLVPALIITVVSTLVSLGIALAAGQRIEPVAVPVVNLVLGLVLIVLLVPFQAAAEEYVFRGLLMQTIGAWVRPVWVAIVLSTVLFTIGHTQYELWGMLSVAVMGAGFAIVAWRTGGLEAGIALHVVNNLIALALLATGATGTTQMSSEGSGPEAPLLQAIFAAAFVLWVDRLATRSGIERVRPLPVPAPVAPHAPVAPPA
ncbi:CPBP family intramembrane glutamic endopeptidase [Protaetiibacter intestinalis]|uniref:CPBP family intramembrane metalloprotease n=1 Tax=Protaetiibacter intestinalis TaxID=2419774 RepID=A0A387B5E1_9MICO|nr:CPBP family intramembrane glutamic endopeptidase [Protaetiibacter intestinalis]AYF98914.1 CPBP family intramembrane metalloprotease [Protaetiibacter intestinalis]